MDIAYLNSASTLAAPHPTAILFHSRAFCSQQLVCEAIGDCNYVLKGMGGYILILHVMAENSHLVCSSVAGKASCNLCEAHTLYTLEAKT